MSVIKRIWGVVGSGFLAVGSAWAALEWSATARSVAVHPLQATAVAEFEFVNIGSESVAILDLIPLCSCIEGVADTKRYAPGETGVVKLVFDLQGRTGVQRKGLAVKTDDRPDPVHLYLDVAIPASYTASVKRLVWEAGAERVTQSCRLVNGLKEALALERAEAQREGVRVELKPIRKGFEYELVVVPSPEFERGLVPIRIYPVKPEGVDAVRTFTIYALVK